MLGLHYSYFPNNWKTHLLVKPDFYFEAKTIFAGTGIQISLDGFQYLGGAIESHNFIKQVVEIRSVFGVKSLTA